MRVSTHIILQNERVLSQSEKEGTLANAPDPFSSCSGGLWLAHFSMCQPISLLHSLLSEARAEWLVANQSLLCGLWTPATLQFKSSLPRHSTLVTPPSAEGPAKKARRETQKPEAHDPEASGSTPKATYRELSAEQGEAIEDAIMEEIQPLEDGSVPSFAGTYLEKGVLVASCINEHTKRWLEEVIQRIKPLGDDISLRVGLRRDILRSTRVFFRAHPKLLKKTPEKVLEMFNKQNPNLNVNEWKILPSKPDPKGYGFICFLDEPT
ncbi:hypothetical protein J6590_014906 [Homalodisca vitripennis]|nr:hypothetical protein J6590_014906 [Homalodisca vitripennis]